MANWFFRYLPGISPERMKLHQIRDLLAVAEKGSLRAAARHLRLAQPSISRSIHALEKELDVPLLERSARGTTLTPSGKLFARRASAAATELRRAREELQQMHGKATGALSVALSSVPLLALLPKAYSPFARRYPLMELHVTDSAFPGIEAQLRDGRIDFYVGVAPEKRPAPGLVVEKLFDNTRLVVARHGHPLAGARKLADLAGARWVSTSITANAQAEIGDLFRQHGLPAPRIGATTTGGALGLITLLSNSDLLAIVPRQWLEYSPTRGALAKIDLKEKLAAPPIVIIRRAALPLTPAAGYFCDLLSRASSKA